VFGMGLHMVPGGYAARDSSANMLIAAAGATVELASPAPVPASVNWHFGTIDVKAGATVAGAVIFASRVNLGAGATFSPQQGGDHSTAPDAVIGALYNHGGDLVGADGLTIGLVSSDHPEFVQNWGGVTGFGATGNFGFVPTESVVPVANGLNINLGDIAQGTSLDPINIALANVTLAESLYALGSGYTTALLPITAPAHASATEQAAVVLPDTASLGTYTERIVMSGGFAPQTLTITDHIV
jgi:hypothetical protein